MIKKILVSALPFALLFILSSNQMSDNGRAGRTGSPGETNCRNCHSDFALNSGGGSITLQSPGMPTFQYTPGQTYTMSVTVSRSANGLFGVGIEALNAANDNAGTLNITDPASTQIKSATVGSVSRRNVVHTLNGGASPASKVFNFSWTAPVAGTGNVTFYFAGVAADADGNESGDYVYTSSQVFTEASCLPPAQPGTVSGTSSLCSSTAVTYSVAAVSGATSYTWTLPSGWTGTSTTTSINAISGNTSGNVSVTANNACGSSVAQLYPVTVNAISATPVITNVSCFGGANGAASVSPTGGTAPYTYTWSPSGGTSSSAGNLVAGNYSVVISDANGCRSTISVPVTQPTAITTQTSSVNVSCFGSSNGTASVMAIGGMSTYSYNWLPSGGTSALASGLGPGNYTVTVTDANGCTKTSSVAIFQPSQISLSLSGTDPTCGLSNGDVIVNASGGTGTFSYSWNTQPVQTTATATNLAAGNYAVTVTDANGCTMVNNFTLNQTATLYGNSQVSDVSCNGGNNGFAVAIALGGTPAYSYNWNTIPTQTNDTAVNLTAGVYTVIISDQAGCTHSLSITVGEPTALIASAGSDQNVCLGDSVSLGGQPSASGGTGPYTFAWSPPTYLSNPFDSTTFASPTADMSYTYTVTDLNGCLASSNVNVFVNQLPVPFITISNDTLVTPLAYGYQWFLNGNAITGATDLFYVPLANGDYTVFVTDQNGCSDTSSVFVLNTLGTSFSRSESRVVTYPNPVTDILIVNLPEEMRNSSLSLYNFSGQRVLKIKNSYLQNKLDLTGLAEGNYNLVIEKGNLVASEKIIIAKK